MGVGREGGYMAGLGHKEQEKGKVGKRRGSGGKGPSGEEQEGKREKRVWDKTRPQ